MENKSNFALIALIGILALLVGVLAGAAMFSTQTIKEVEVKVPVDKIVEKIVNQTVTVEVPVIVDSFKALVANATKEYKNALDEEENLVCDEVQYDIDQVSFLKQEDLVVSVDNTDSDDTVTTVSFSERLKFKDSDVNEKGYRTDAVEVIFHSDTDKDTQVFINGEEQ
jgi:hypothetical protein